MRIIKASEIGTYLFCHRAHWYRRKGIDSENVIEMESGTKIHQQHSRAVAISGCSRSVAIIVLLAGFAMLIYVLVGNLTL